MAEPLNATFFAFRKREKSGVLMGASIGFAIAMIVLLVAFGAAAFFLLGGTEFFSYYTEVMEAAARGESSTTMPPNPTGILLILPLELVWLFLLFVLLAAYEASSVRWMLRGEESAPFKLNFGADMWRVYGTYWAWLLYVVLGWVGFLIVVFIAGIAGGNAGAAGVWISFGICLAYFLAWFYATVRLSPASATSIGVGEFAPLKAWSVTRDRFWALFGSYLLIGIIYLVVYAILGAIFLGSFYSTIFSGLDWSVAQSDPTAFAQSYEQASMRAMQQMFGTPTGIALYVGGQIVLYAVALVFYLLWFGVEARAVQAALEEGKIERKAASAA